MSELTPDDTDLTKSAARRAAAGDVSPHADSPPGQTASVGGAGAPVTATPAQVPAHRRTSLSPGRPPEATEQARNTEGTHTDEWSPGTTGTSAEIPPAGQHRQ